MDSGGTFTDVVVLDNMASEWSLYKVLSQRHNPSAVLHEGIAKAAEGAGIGVEAFIADTEMFILGTTVATNALLQHRGAKVGLLATRGHQDSLEIREGHKEDGHRYDWDYPPAEVLVPRRRRIPIAGRLLSDGTEREPLDMEELEQAVQMLKKEAVEAVAISFLWSFQSPDHELRAAEVVRREMPDTYLCASHELLPMIGEYNRVSTVVVNAYLAPVVKRFVDGMEAALADVGFRGPIRYFQANGGMSSGPLLATKAIYALNSGPAAAPTAGAEFSRMYSKDVITVDAGGTSLDVGLVRGTETDVRLTSDVARYRIGIPMVNIETLGAGGGSIAWIDTRGLLSVGPQSAEARPGPACYGFGGTEPTVTDAFVVLGWFNQKSLLGGEMPIDANAASSVVEERIAKPLGLTTEQAAEGIIRIAAGNMVGGIQRASIERGYDPRDAVLVAIGGSGPAFACRLARDLDMTTVVVPRVASGFCAFGAALSDVQHDFVATYASDLNHVDLDRFNAILEGLEQRGREELAAEAGVSEVVVRRSLEMRYADQVHNCLVQIPVAGVIDADAVAVIREAFDRRHEQLFTYAEPWNDALLVNVHVSVIGRQAKRAEHRWFRPVNVPTSEDTREHTAREVYLPSHGKRVAVPVIAAVEVTDGMTVEGPAIVEEITTTILVEEGWTLRLDDRGFYEVTWGTTDEDRDLAHVREEPQTAARGA
jgi:N-methylhydantoinase A